MGKYIHEEYDTITEETATITDPDQTKNHIADYFENLYQGREGEKSHAEWTKNIDNKIDQITNMKYEQTHHEISQKEINKNTKTLQRGQSTGPDIIPNERGITLASNMGKLFERIVNNRITKTVDITEAQAGGQKGKSTEDHLLILNTIIKHHTNTNTNQDLHIAFLNIAKTCDNACLNAIPYALTKSELKEKIGT